MGVLKCNVTSAPSLNHIVEVVGYDTNGNWIIKNSWGRTWGVNGFAYVSSVEDCSMRLYVAQFSEVKGGGNGGAKGPAFESNWAGRGVMLGGMVVAVVVMVIG